MTKFEKNFLEQMLKMIRIFVLAAYSINEDETVFEVLELVRNKSSVKEEGTTGVVDQEEEEAKYQTPAKKNKPKFVQKLHEKRVQFNADILDSEITEELLFGGQQSV